MIQEQAPVTINSINNMDVLSGRGGLTNKHAGNKLFRSLVKKNRPHYQQLKNNAHKLMLAESIIAAIDARQGRFLKRLSKDSDNWIELTDEEVVTKTTQALREIPAGTSSRTINVERMLEKNRQEKHAPKSSKCDGSYTKAVTTLGTLKSQPPPPPLHPAFQGAPKDEQHVSLRGFPSSRMPVPETYVSAQGPHVNRADDQVLRDEELESLVSDSDAVQTLCSLLE